MAFSLTQVYCSVCALHLHRTVLAALCTTFDFVFLSVQLTVVRASLCDLLHWHQRGSLSVATTWLWIHWVLTLDALTPVMRLKLSVRRRFALAVLLAYTSGSVLLLWGFMTATRLRAMYTRVLWSGSVLDHTLELRLLPLFTNCLVTALALCLRLVWRLARSSAFDELLVLNGAVVYDNYFPPRRTKQPTQQQRTQEQQQEQE